MAKKCIYCSTSVEENSVVDMCQSCMYQVWGEKMAKAIVEGMEKERDAGNLELGQVGNSSEARPSQVEVKEEVLIEEVSPEELEISNNISEPQASAQDFIEGPKLY